jgi:hypothetical protein
MPVARCSTVLLTRIAWRNGGRQGVRKTQVRRPSGPVACQSRRSAGPLRRGCAQRADPHAAAPVLTERGVKGAGRPDQRLQQRYPHALFFRAPPGVGGLQVAPFHSGLGSRELFSRPVSDGASLCSFVPPVPAEAFVDFLAGGQGRIQPRVERRSPGRRPLGDLLARSAFVRGINHDSLYLIGFQISARWSMAASNQSDMPPPSLGKYSSSLQKRTSSPAPGLPWGNASRRTYAPATSRSLDWPDGVKSAKHLQSARSSPRPGRTDRAQNPKPKPRPAQRMPSSNSGWRNW